MIKKYLKRLIIINKEVILMEVLSIRGLMQLLMKTRNRDERWTRQEKREIKRYLRNIAKIVPTVAIFSLPGGFLFFLFWLKPSIEGRPEGREQRRPVVVLVLKLLK